MNYAIPIVAGSLLLILTMSGKLVESNTSGQILVITSPTGHMKVYTEPGLHWQGFGSTSHYNKRGQLKFDQSPDEDGKNQDRSINIRFNDSGTAQLSGVLNYELSSDQAKLIDMHSQYQTPEAVEASLIGTALQRSIFVTGSLMSSTESYSTRRSDLFSLIGDQIRQGVYATSGNTQTVSDKGVEQIQTRVSIKVDPKTGQPLIAEKSVLERYGVTLQTLSLSGIKYDSKVEGQITAQLDATIKVQTAIAEAKKSEQDTITATQKGLADKAEAEAKANVTMASAVIAADQEKAVAVTKAEQQKETAQLALDAAKLEAEAVVAKGKGDAEAASLKMAADGALDKKLEAYVAVQSAYATAFGNSKVPLVPSVVMGGSASGTTTGNTNGMEQLLQTIAIKSLKDLDLDLSMPKVTLKPSN